MLKAIVENLCGAPNECCHSLIMNSLSLVLDTIPHAIYCINWVARFIYNSQYKSFAFTSAFNAVNVKR